METRFTARRRMVILLDPGAAAARRPSLARTNGHTYATAPTQYPV